MAKLSVAISANDEVSANVVKKERRIETLPEGKHNFKILECDIKTSKAGENYIGLVVEIVDGEYAGLVSSHRYCIYHSNEVVAKYAMINLKSLLKVLGIKTFEDTEELVGGFFGGMVGKQKNNQAFTEIKFVYESSKAGKVRVADKVVLEKPAVNIEDEEIPLTDEDIKAAEAAAEKFNREREAARQKEEDELRARAEAARQKEEDEARRVREEAVKAVDARQSASMKAKADASIQKVESRKIAPPPWVSKF